jgi:hypothetical protein
MSPARLGKTTLMLVGCTLAPLFAASSSPVELSFERAIASPQDDFSCSTGACPGNSIYFRSAVNISDYRHAPPLNGAHARPAAMRPQISTRVLIAVGLVGLATVGRLKRNRAAKPTKPA